MIEVQSLTRRYGATAAVQDVSFCLRRNEIVGLLGHNGAGKTTIMRMLSGYLEPHAGTITLDGVDIASAPLLLRQNLGYMPENPPLYPEMSVVDYLEYAATLKEIGRRERLRAVREALAATDLSQRALDRIGQLSRGMRQRVGVAQAILGRPRVLILDEPTNGLDPRQTQHMRELIRRLARSAAVILSTHIMQEVDAVCERVLLLREGRLALDTRLEELYRSRTLVLVADGDAATLQHHLAHLPQVCGVRCSEAPGRLHRFELDLHDNADMDTASSNVASCVINANARLCQLAPALRDLHSVFSEVSDGGD